MTQVFTVRRARAFDHAADRVFRLWLDPAARARFETPAGADMSHVACATAQGESGEVRIASGGSHIGSMFDTLRILHPGRLAVVHGWGVFGGDTTMTMQTAFEVVPDGDGCTFTGTSQMVVPGDRPTEAQVGAGWDAMLDRFATLLDDTPIKD